MIDHVALRIATHLFVHGTLVLSVAWLAVRYVPDLPAAGKHAIWTTAFATLLLLPAGAWMLPGWGFDLTTIGQAPRNSYAQPVVLAASPGVPADEVNTVPTSADATDVPEEPVSSSSQGVAPVDVLLRYTVRWGPPVFLLVWGSGALLLLGRLALGMVALRKWRPSAADAEYAQLAAPLARQLNVARPFTVRRSPEAHVPIAWGVVMPSIILPAEARRWPTARLQSVLLHELAHIKRWDYPTRVLSRVARALFWLNPLMWIATERSTTAQEQACDDVVLQSGVSAWEYAEQLLAVAKTLQHQAPPVDAVALDAGRQFKSRMRTLLQSKTPHRAATGEELGTILVAGLILLGTVSAVHLGPAAPFSDQPALHWFEAEQTSLPAAFTLRESDQASQGTYVEITQRAEDLDRPPRANPAVYAFETSGAGRHVIWARMRIRSDDHDSIWLRVDSTRWIRWNDIERGDRWHWVQVQDADQEGRPVAFDLSEGPHQLMLSYREDGIAIDRLLVTRNWNYQPRDRGGSVLEAAAGHQIWLEAEDGWPQMPLQVVHAPHASGWKHLEARPGDNSMDTAPDAGHATYTFTAPRGGTYRLWGRVIATSTSSDSFWLRMNDGPWIRWNGIQPGRQWHWDEVHDTDRNHEPVRFDLSAGDHQLTVAYRERHAKLDRLLLTSSSTYRPRGAGDPPRGFTPFSQTLSVAEATLVPPMTLRADTQSTDSRSWIEVPDGPDNDPPRSGPGAATFTFTVPETGRYVVWGNVQAKARNDNSFYVSINGGEEIVWHAPAPDATADGWRWDPISSGRGTAFTDPVIFSLDAGTHQLRIRNREDGTRLRRLYITNRSLPIAP